MSNTDDWLPQAEEANRTTVIGHYAPVNGLDLYYEIHGARHGERAPLVLLHGGLGTISEQWGDLMPRLAQHRQIIAVELQGHGHTALGDRPLSFAMMADDIGALLTHLGVASADIFGYSLGGGVAMQTAIRHPAAVGKLIVVSAACRRDGWHPEVLAGMGALNADAAQTIKVAPIYQAYLHVAPQPDDWPRLVTQLGQMLVQDYDWSTALAALTIPVLIVVGDADSVRPAHALEMFGLLGGGQRDGASGGMPRSQLAVLPATTHFTVLNNTDLILSMLTPFLDTPIPETDEAAQTKTQ